MTLSDGWGHPLHPLFAGQAHGSRANFWPSPHDLISTLMEDVGDLIMYEELNLRLRPLVAFHNAV